MDREKTINAVSFEDAANKKWYLSMKPASPKETLEVKFDDGKAYKFLGTGQVKVGDPVIIDYGGASSYKMGNVVGIEKGFTIKRAHALKPLFTFTTNPGKAEIKKNLAGIVEMKEAKDASSCFDSFYLYNNNDRFHIVDHLVGEVLNAISVVAFPDLAGDKAVTKAKIFLAEEKSVPGFVFGRDFSDMYFAAGSDVPCAAEYAENSFTGFYPGWKEDLLNCEVWENNLGKVEKTWDEREQAYYLCYTNGSKKLENLFNKSESFKKMTNELVFRSALSILIRGGFKNLLEAALSVQMPITEFYNKLLEFAKDIGSSECYDVLKNTDYKNKKFDKVKSSQKKAVVLAASKDFVIDDVVLKEYKGNDEVVIIPDGIKTIDKHAFANNYTLKKVIMPDTVTAIKDAAFQWCSDLEEIVFSKKLTTIGPFAFSTNKALRSVDLSNTKVKSIRKKCFIACENLEIIKLPETVKSIEDSAFERTAITEFHFPASIEKIASSAFGAYTRIVTDLYFEGTNAIDFSSRAFSGGINGERVHIYCKKDSELWKMFEVQREQMEAWNKSMEDYAKKNNSPFPPSVLIIPEYIEL